MPSVSAGAADAPVCRAADRTGPLHQRVRDAVSVPVGVENAAVSAVVTGAVVSGRHAVRVKARDQRLRVWQPTAARRSRLVRKMRRGVRGWDVVPGVKISLHRLPSPKAGTQNHRHGKNSHARSNRARRRLAQGLATHQEKADAAAVMAVADAITGAATTNGVHGASRHRGPMLSPRSMPRPQNPAESTAVDVIQPSAFVIIKPARTPPGRTTTARTPGLPTTCQRSYAGQSRRSKQVVALGLQWGTAHLDD